MKRYLPATLLLAMFAVTAPLAADDPPPTAVLKLDAPASVAIGDLATVAVNPASNVQDVQFLIAPACLNPLNVKTGPDFVSFVCGADCPKGGKFTVFAAGNLNGKTITAEAIVVFGQPPAPPVPPGPTPPPTPTPKAAHLWLIGVYDKTNPAAEITALVSDVQFWFGIASAGHQSRFLSTADTMSKPYIDAASKLGVSGPFLMFMDADTKKVLAVKSLPVDEATITDEIATLTGGST